MRLVEHIVSTGDKKSVYKDFVGKLEGERDHYDGLVISGRIILKRSSRNQMEGYGLDSSSS
jgi:hypothetical protein